MRKTLLSAFFSSALLVSGFAQSPNVEEASRFRAIQDGAKIEAQGVASLQKDLNFENPVLLNNSSAQLEELGARYGFTKSSAQLEELGARYGFTK